MPTKKVIVVGAGIGGLTTAALLAKRGYLVKVYDQAIVPGGCASTFKRKGFIFDVGATQVAGLEQGGIHQQIFTELDVPIPEYSPCDPACAVFLPGETNPINIWRDPQKWKEHRQQQFPGSEPFWQLLTKLFEISLRFQSRNPVLPPKNWWDLRELVLALRAETMLTVPFSLLTVRDLLRLLGLDKDRRLKTFLDIQLKLYSQTDTNQTALLYAATALSLSQSPHGLYHLQGSMQALSDSLLQGLNKYQGELFMQHRVELIEPGKVTVRNLKTNNILQQEADYIVANTTVQDLVKLTPALPNSYRKNVERLEKPSGAFVIYLGVKDSAIPVNCPPHLQFLYDYHGPIGEDNSLFVSVSKPGDGRAPVGKATIIASCFTDIDKWWGDSVDYPQLKEQYSQATLKRLAQYFNLTNETIVHQESATPRTFFHYTGRELGIVGGIGQRLSTFGPLAIANRTSINSIYLVGDSTHPGEGTAGVSYSALTVVRQIEADS